MGQRLAESTRNQSGAARRLEGLERALLRLHQAAQSLLPAERAPGMAWGRLEWQRSFWSSLKVPHPGRGEEVEG